MILRGYDPGFRALKFNFSSRTTRVKWGFLTQYSSQSVLSYTETRI